MRRTCILTLFLGLILLNPIFAQEKISKIKFREINQNETKLSDSDNQRISKLESAENIKATSITQIDDISSIINEDDLIFVFSGKIGDIKAKKKDLILNSFEDFVWTGEGKNTEVIIGKNKGKIYGQIRKNGKVIDIQDLGEGKVILIEYDIDKINALECAVTEVKNDLNQHSKKDFKVENFQVKEVIKIPSNDEEFRTTPFIIRTLVLFTPAAAGVGLDVESIVNTAFQQWQIAAVNTNTITSL